MPYTGSSPCPHCNGKTKCNCGTCGIDTGKKDEHGAKELEYGICTICNGTGRDPNARKYG